jgi:GntR family transcriptional regulator, galactonate operon transcriptional repressor
MTMRGLVGQIVKRVGTEIISGRMKPAQPLPREAEWAEELGVSRTVLREAVKVLISKGLVTSRPRIGTKVNLDDQWNLLDPEVLSWRLDAASKEDLVRELFELRRIIEPAIAARAAEKATEADIKALSAAYAAMDEKADDAEGFIGPDSEFHKTIVRSVENRMVKALGNLIDAALTLSLRLTLETPGGHRPSLALHKKVLDAIRCRDRSGAQCAMELLIDNAQQDALKALDAEVAASTKKRRSA